MVAHYSPAIIHPDDGWVDRQHNTMYPAYPQFSKPLEVGDWIILGHHDKWRAVKCVGIVKQQLGGPRYQFSEANHAE